MASRPERASSRLTVTWPAAAIVVTALALGGVSTGLGDPDRLITSSFETALKNRETAPDRIARPTEGADLIQLSGSEEFWLNARSPIANTVPVVLKDSLRPGDRVTFGAGAAERRYEVVDIRAIGDAGSIAGLAPAAVPLMLITCRDVAAPDAPPLRFVIERADTPTGAVRRTPHAL